MNPPWIAEALIAAAAPAADYEIIAGDLHEEYAERMRSSGEVRANRWYWSQVLRSIPALLSYSRGPRSRLESAMAIGAGAVVLLGMLYVRESINSWIAAMHPAGFPHWLYILVDWSIAAFFGAILAVTVRAHGVRAAAYASSALVLAIVIPTLLGFSSRLPIYAWVLIFGAVPAMSLGAAASQIARARFRERNHGANRPRTS